MKGQGTGAAALVAHQGLSMSPDRGRRLLLKKQFPAKARNLATILGEEKGRLCREQ